MIIRTDCIVKKKCRFPLDTEREGKECLMNYFQCNGCAMTVKSTVHPGNAACLV
jgi:hypothetical protein